MSSENMKKTQMGRPKSEEKRSAILQAAGCEFLQSGYEGTSVDRIAENAGVSKATVYSHFPGKEDLFQAVIKSKVESYEFDEGAHAPENLKEGLTNIAMRFFELLSDPQVISMHRVVIGESVRHCDMAKLFFKNGPDKTNKTLAKYLDQHVKNSNLKIDNTKEAATQFFHMVAGELLLRSMLNMPLNMSKKSYCAHVKKTTNQFISLYKV